MRSGFVRDVVWNVAGTGLPLVAAVIATPALIDGLGAAKFGLLSLAWIVVGYFSLFDLGLGRALTHLVAERMGFDDSSSVPSLVWTGIALLAVLGVAGAAVSIALSPWIVDAGVTVPVELAVDAQSAFLLLACSIPLVIVSSGLRGVLEGYGRFDLVNLVRIPLGVASYLAPMMALQYSTSLVAMVSVLVVSRLVGTMAFAVICYWLLPGLSSSVRIDRDVATRLVSFGGWMTVSNVVGPLLLYLGRFVIAARLSAEAVAYFSVPYDALINLLTVPAVLVTVLFPAFSGQFQRDVSAARHLYRRGQLYLAIVMTPVCAVAFLLARFGLETWINSDFALNGYRVAQWLAIGIFINSFGHVAQAVVQSSGRPDITAKLHIAELILYVPYLIWFIDSYGVVGAAVAWVVRVAISTVCLVAFAERSMRRDVAKMS